MFIRDIQIVKNTFTGKIFRSQLPHQYFKCLTTPEVEICGFFELDGNMVLLDTVIVDDDKSFINLPFMYIDTRSIALQIEAQVLLNDLR